MLVKYAPDDSPIARALTDCGHTVKEHLDLAEQFLLSVANWQRAGDRKVKPPRLPDCMLPPEERETQKIGGSKPLPVEDMADWLGWERPNLTVVA